MKRSRLIVAAVMLSAWGLFVFWQQYEYQHQRDQIRSSLAQQAESILDCLVSSVQSHRWIGPYFQSQLPGTLAQIATSPSVLAVSIAAVPSESASETTGKVMPELYLAGDTELLLLADASESNWRTEGYFAVRSFELKNSPPGGEGLGGGGGPGGGQGGGSRGSGFGMGRRLQQTETLSTDLPNEFTATLILARSEIDSQIAHEATNRILLVMFGGLLILATGLVWQSTVRLADSQGRAGVLRAEARHLSELGQAAAGLAHETRNPLGLIRGWAQRLADLGLPTPEQKQQADAIVEECDRVTVRINEFLSFARPAEPQLRPVPIRELVQQLALLLETDLTAKQVKLDFSGIPQSLSIMADTELLRQAVFNLVQNAVYFARDDGSVTLSMVQNGKRCWCLAVADDGPGVDPAVRDSLFEPYFTTRSSGTGLGLAIVQRIALAHHWTVRYESNQGSGAIFSIDAMHEA